MGDVLFVSILVMFFAVSVGLIRLVEGLVTADVVEQEDDDATSFGEVAA